MNLYLIKFTPCGTQFLVNQETEETAFQSAVKANRIVGEMEGTDLYDKSLFQI